MPRTPILPAPPSSMSAIRCARYWAWRRNCPGRAIRPIRRAPSTMAICRGRNGSAFACGLPRISEANRDKTMKPILLAALLSLISTGAFCGDNLAALTIRDHKFSPPEIHVKAQTPTTVTLTNEDDQTEEFDSTA